MKVVVSLTKPGKITTAPTATRSAGVPTIDRAMRWAAMRPPPTRTPLLRSSTQAWLPKTISQG